VNPGWVPLAENNVMKTLLKIICHRRETYPKEGHGGTAVERSVGYFSLLCQISGVLDWCDHSLHRQKGRQIGRIRGNYN